MDQTERKVPNTTIGLVQSIEFLMSSAAKLSGILHDGRKPLSIHNARKDAYNRSYSRAFSSLTDVFETLSLGPSFTSTLPSLTPDFIHMTSDYNENSATQASSAMKLIPVLQKLAKRLDSKLPNSVALSVCEYGCATGGSSLEPLNAIKEGCKVSKRPLKAAMNDLPGNDWNVLAQTLKPLDRDFEFTFKKTSMYNPIVEAGSTHLAYSNIAQHWLNNGAPTSLPDGAIWANQLPISSPEFKAWSESSMEDWNIFLKQRSYEMMPGGYLVVNIQSSCLDSTMSENAAATLQKAKQQMIQDGDLGVEEASKMIIPEYFKSLAQILEPLKSEKNLSIWKVEEAQYFESECPFKAEIDNLENSIQDKELLKIANEKIVERQIGIQRSFMDSSLESAIGIEKLNLFWTHVAMIAGSDSSALRSNFSSVIIVLRRLDHDINGVANGNKSG